LALVTALTCGAAHAAGSAADATLISEPRLAVALRSAQEVAAERLAGHHDCRELFARRGADGARLLSTTEYAVAEAGERDSLCARGAVAFTRLGTDRTTLCRDGFLRLDRQRGAVVLLHEALHVAGMGERPHHPRSLTPQEIDRMVKRSCGL
jgi:hypothetical protein